MRIVLVLFACGGCLRQLEVGEHRADGFTTDAAGVDAAEAGIPDAGFADTRMDVFDDSTCAARSRWIYLISFEQELLRYQPSEANTVTRLGRVSCPGADPEAHNMTVDRSGRAWLFDQSGALFHVDTSDASCEATAFRIVQMEFEFLGATFAYDPAAASASTPQERLLVSGGPSLQPSNGWSNELAVIDTDTLSLTRVRRVEEGTPLLLTSSGEGDLWALVGEDSSTGLLRMNLDGSIGERVGVLPTTLGFQSTVVFWGGRFYAFVPSGPGEGTSVFTYTPTTNAWEFVIELEERIVGGGVSTCAPVVLI